MGISVLWLDIPIHITMVFSAAFAVLVLMIQGRKWDDISEAIVYGGTVPIIIYLGLKLINSTIFLATSCAV